MSGVGKTDAELDLAISSRVLAVQVESVEEVDRVAARARALGIRTRVSIRINPGVDADTHAHIATGHDAAKFGVALFDVASAWRRIDEHDQLLEGVGVSVHVGSMLAEQEPYLAGGREVCSVARARLASGKQLSFVDFGGGFGIDHGQRPVAAPAEFARSAAALLRTEGLDDLRLVIEPGRSMVGPHGVLVARVIQARHRGMQQWIVIDAGMNDLIRPALYQARHRIEPVERPPDGDSWRVVGPVCESADDFGSHPLGAQPPQAVVIRDAGAYGFVMASEYNGRPLPSEVFVASGSVCSVSRSPGPEDWVKRRLEA
jgi:diaminopimelate decarboxylase